MLVQNQVGPIAATQSIGAGTLSPQRAGNLGDTIVSELHGRYYEQTYRRNMFVGATPVGQTTVAFTSGTTTAGLTGLILNNPIGSTVNMVLTKWWLGFPVINTTVNEAILALGYNSSTALSSTTAAAVNGNSLFQGVGASSQGKAYAVATVPTAPVTSAFLASMPTATTLPSTASGDFEGSIILPPGAYACFITLAASPTSGFAASAFWEEVPV